MYICMHVCMYVYHMCTWCYQRTEEDIDPLELETVLERPENSSPR